MLVRPKIDGPLVPEASHLSVGEATSSPERGMPKLSLAGVTGFVILFAFVAIWYHLSPLAPLAAGKMLGELIGLCVAIGIVFYFIERCWPEDELQAPWDRDSGISGFFLVFNLAVTLRITESVLLTVLAVVAICHFPHLAPTAISRQPIWLQICELAVLKDFFNYWNHRAFHEIPWLWRFHQVHHSSKHISWVSAGREHPVEMIISKLLTMLPLLLLGFPPDVLGGYVGVWTLFNMLQHSNCKWEFGPFRTLIVSPAFHRWHHSSMKEALDKNYSSLLPVWDYLFKTVYFPKNEHSAEYGLHGFELPNSVTGQTLAPLLPQPQPRPLTVVVAPPSSLE